MSFKIHEAFREKPTEEPSQEEAVDHKQSGNEAFKEGNYDEAIDHYNKAISLDANQASLYSNRAACWAQKGEHEKALKDAESSVGVDPKFTKAYARKGHALFYLERLDEAKQAYMDGLKIDPTSEPCKRGLTDCTEKKAQGKPRRRRPFEGLLAYAKTFVDKVKADSRSGRFWTGTFIIISVLVAVTGSYLWSRSDSNDVYTKAFPVHVQRRFKRMDGIWLSYLEAGIGSHTKLLVLHRTSLSGEAEFGAIIPELLRKVNDKRLKVVVPDRPCHGYSLCPEEGEPKEAFTLFGRILSERPLAQKFAYMTSGRESARHALEIVQRRRQPANVLLIRPQMVIPDSRGATSPLAAAESARWTLLASELPSNKEGEREPLDVAKMPQDCKVMLVYLDGDLEDIVLQKALEAAHVPVEIHRIDSLEDGLVSAASHMFGVSGPPKAVSTSEGNAPSAETEEDFPDAESDSELGWSDWLVRLAVRHLSKDKVRAKLGAWKKNLASGISSLLGGPDEEVW